MAKTPEENKSAETKEPIELIGRNLGIEKAKNLFGAEKAYQAMHAVAQAGGHGSFKDSDFDHPLFGGLQIPQGDDFEAMRSKINTALKNL